MTKFLTNPRRWDRATEVRRAAEEAEHLAIAEALPVGATVCWRLNESTRYTDVLRHSGDRVKVRGVYSGKEYWVYASTIRSGLIDVEVES